MNKDIVSTNEEDKPLIIISEEAINLKRDNDKLKQEIERLKREKDIVIKLNHFLNYEVKRILKDDELPHIEKLQEISKVFEGVVKSE